MENTDQILDAPQVETMRFEYAGFWIRVLAYIIDAVLLYCIDLVINVSIPDIAEGLVASLISMVIAVCYFSAMEASEYQATLGKLACGIRVGDRNGDQLSVLNAVGRYFAKLLSGILLCIGYLMVAWDDKNQGLHDKLADTYVYYRGR